MPRILANGVHLNYVEAGRGEPSLVLLHGVGGSHEMWLPLLPALSGARRVIAGDHRGHGASDKPRGPYTTHLLADDWLAALDGLGVARADLLGLSLGGAVAMRLAVAHPERVRRLVLLDTWGVAYPEFATLMRERLAVLAQGDLRAYADLSISQVFSDDYARRHPDEMEAYRVRAGKADLATLGSAVGACITHDMLGDLGRITAPTLIVVGRQDRLTPLAYAEHLMASIPGATLAVVEGVAHFPHVERPQEFLGILTPFLEGG